ncbi:hypothetical protein ACFX19_002580 [Malus domestica]
MPKRVRPYGFKLRPSSLHLRFTLYYHQPDDQKYVQYSKIIREPATIITNQVIKTNQPFLASSFPTLGLDDFSVDIQATGGELDAYGGLRLEAKLVSGKPRQQVELADAGDTDRHHLEKLDCLAFCLWAYVFPVPRPRQRST